MSIEEMSKEEREKLCEEMIEASINSLNAHTEAHKTFVNNMDKLYREL